MCEQTRKQARASKFLRRTSRSCSIARSVLNKGRIEKLGCKEEDFRWKDLFDMVFCSGWWVFMLRHGFHTDLHRVVYETDVDGEKSSSCPSATARGRA